MGKGRSGRKQHPQQAGQAGRYQSPIGTGEQRDMYGVGHANNEREYRHNDERHEGTGIHQLGRASSVD